MDDYYYDEDGFAPKTYVPIYDDPWQLRDVLYENVTYDVLKRKINDLTLTEIGCPAKRFDDLNWFTEGPTEWSTSIKQRYVNRFKIAALLAYKVKKLDALYSFQTEKGEKQILPLNQYGIVILQFYTDNYIDNYETFNKFIENFFGDALLPSYMNQINFTNMNDDILEKIQFEIRNSFQTLDEHKPLYDILVHYLGKNGEVPPVETIQLEQPKQQESVKPYEGEIKEADKDVYVPDEVILEDEEQPKQEVKQIKAPKQAQSNWGWNGQKYAFPNEELLKSDTVINQVKDDLIVNTNLSKDETLIALHSLQYQIFDRPVDTEELDDVLLYIQSLIQNDSESAKELKYNKIIDFFKDAIDFCLVIRKGFNDFNKKYPGLDIDISEIGKIIMRVTISRMTDYDFYIQDLKNISANFFLEYDVYFQKVLKTLGSYPDLATPAARYEEVKRRFYFVDPKLGNIFEYYLNNYNLTGRSFSKFLDYLNTVIYQEAKKDGNYSTIPQTMAQKDAQDGDKLAKGYAEYYEIKKSILYWVEKDKERLKGWNDDKIDEYANFFHDTFLSSEVHERINEFFTNIIKYGVGVPDVLKPDEITELTNLLIEKRQKLGKEVDAVEAKNEIVKDYLSQYLKYDHIVNAINADFALEVKTNTNDVKKIIQQILSEKNGISPSESEVEKYFQEKILKKFQILPDQRKSKDTRII